MKTKLKFLLLGLIAFVVVYAIPTNAYDFNFNDYTIKVPYASLAVSYGCYVYSPSFSFYFQTTASSCSSGSPFHSGYSHNNFSHGGYNFVATSRVGEGLNFYYQKMNGNIQSFNTFSIPSRTAYQYTNTQGNTYNFTEYYVYHNQFLLYDPITKYSVSFLGNVKIENLMILSYPGRLSENFWIVSLQKGKAWSATIPLSSAWDYFFGKDITLSKVQSIPYDKSYTIYRTRLKSHLSNSI